ncbi:hypothetical protein HNQ03_000325 [Chryseobacterium sp. 16F]|uniref:Uncharacterized protein n=1 Tax=Frigoriflavimonas asaccharolytica TaxID=2735899 RepID=A0A8J8G838_9FLAO|nr:hypothetical protein [Frigoriflavimonas asaccharolytica]
MTLNLLCIINILTKNSKKFAIPTQKTLIKNKTSESLLFKKYTEYNMAPKEIIHCKTVSIFKMVNFFIAENSNYLAAKIKYYYFQSPNYLLNNIHTTDNKYLRKVHKIVCK